MEQKLGGLSWTLGVGDLKCKCKKDSRTKMRNKSSGIKIGGDHWALGNGDPKYKCKRVPTNFCSAFLFSWPFCTSIWGPQHPMSKSPHQFLFHILVPVTFLHLHLRSSAPNVQWSPPFFVPQFLFRSFCSAFFIPHFCSPSHPCVNFTLHNILLNLWNFLNAWSLTNTGTNCVPVSTWKKITVQKFQYYPPSVSIYVTHLQQKYIGSKIIEQILHI